jgi:hypothetical protein
MSEWRERRRRFAELREKKSRAPGSLSHLFSQQSPQAPHNQLIGINIKAAHGYSRGSSLPEIKWRASNDDRLFDFHVRARQLFTRRKRVIRAKWNANVKCFLRRSFANALNTSLRLNYSKLKVWREHKCPAPFRIKDCYDHIYIQLILCCCYAINFSLFCYLSYS